MYILIVENNFDSYRHSRLKKGENGKKLNFDVFR